MCGRFFASSIYGSQNLREVAVLRGSYLLSCTQLGLSEYMLARLARAMLYDDQISAKVTLPPHERSY